MTIYKAPVGDLIVPQPLTPQQWQALAQWAAKQ